MAENSPKNSSKKPFLKAAFFSLLFLILLALGTGLFLVQKFNSLGDKINPGSEKGVSLFETVREFVTNDYPALKENDGRINILLLGIAGEGKPGQNLTDTIMVLSIDTVSNRVAILSLPRDLFVKIPGTEKQSKINAIYQIGINGEDNPESGAELIQKTVEEIIDQKISYYAILNFDGFEKVIDAIDGINITSERDIYDSRYPGPGYSYETFELKKGFHHLDGKTALKYARVRHGDPEGDFGRAKRQQQIMQATKNKIFSVRTLFNVFTLNKIFGALENNIRTNIRTEEIGSFLELSKKLDTQNINNVVIDAWNQESLLKVAHVPMGDVSAFVLVPKTGNYFEIQEIARNIFNLNEIKRRKDEIQKEDAKISILNLSGDRALYQKIRAVLSEHMNYKNIEEIYPEEEDRETQQYTVIYESGEKSKPFTLDELNKVLGAKFSSDNSSIEAYQTETQTDIFIVLGKDLIEKYNIKEGTLEQWQASQDNL